MIIQNPNLRAIKPLSWYMQLRVRMFGRERIAHEQYAQLDGTDVILSFDPLSPELVEVYMEGSRVLDGYTIEGRLLKFNSAQEGFLYIVSDVSWPEEGEPWLVIDVANYTHSEEIAESAYGTDRRIGPRISTYTKPVVITQGGIGHCRPSIYGDKLLYCPRLGLYGRDSITYALKTDGGQYSDFRCIDIKVRDPNHIPKLRAQVAVDRTFAIMLDGVRHDIVEPSAYQLFDPQFTGSTIEIQNKYQRNELFDLQIVIQGEDEDKDWYGLDEYYDPEEIRFEFEATNNNQIMTYTGAAYPVIGSAIGDLVTIRCTRNVAAEGTLKVMCKGNTLLEITIKTPGILNYSELTYEELRKDYAAIKDVANSANDADWESSYALNIEELRVTFASRVLNRDVNSNYQCRQTLDFDMQVSAPIYDPLNNREFSEAINYIFVCNSTFVSSRYHPENTYSHTVTPQQAVTDPSRLFWENSDVFSQQLVLEPRFIVPTVNQSQQIYIYPTAINLASINAQSSKIRFELGTDVPFSVDRYRSIRTYDFGRGDNSGFDPSTPSSSATRPRAVIDTMTNNIIKQVGGVTSIFYRRSNDTGRVFWGFSSQQLPFTTYVISSNRVTEVQTTFAGLPPGTYILGISEAGSLNFTHTYLLVDGRICNFNLEPVSDIYSTSHIVSRSLSGSSASSVADALRDDVPFQSLFSKGAGQTTSVYYKDVWIFTADFTLI